MAVYSLSVAGLDWGEEQTRSGPHSGLSIIASIGTALLSQLVADAAAGAEILADRRYMTALIALAQAGIKLPAQRRQASRNDAKQIAALPTFPVETNGPPTLVIRGTGNKPVPHTHGLFLAEDDRGAELYATEGGTHVILLTPGEEVLPRAARMPTRRRASSRLDSIDIRGRL